MVSILIAGFLLGFAGSLHCVGMCGPLSLAVPTWHLTGPERLLALFVYQLGRVITYAILGLLFGLAGRGFYAAGIQQWISITLGICMLMLATVYFVHGRSAHFIFFNRFYTSVSLLIGKIIRQNTAIAGFTLLGMLNGLLPCGMVYVALATALSFHEISVSVSFMAMFGAGTVPAMMLVAYSARTIRPSLRKLFKQSVPYFITLIGVALIIRGLDLDIPFLSPRLFPFAGQAISCHK